MWWEGQGWDPVVVGLQTCGPPGATWQLRIPEPPGLQLPQRGEAPHCFPSPKPLCAGVWDQKEWAEDSEGLGVPVGASLAPKHDISAGDPALGSNWPGARNLQGQSSPAAASMPNMGMFLA